MRIDIITCLPKLLEGPFSDSILKRAQEKGLAQIYVHDLRQYSTHKQRSIDDYAYGGGAGMVLQIEPIAAAIDDLKSQHAYDEIIYMSPDGEQFSQPIANELALKGNLLILCGHYKGVDERVREHYITREISIGDYVISGGELAAAVVTDAVIRLIPGVLSDETSALTDSYQDGLLAPPVYSRPAEFKGLKVPDVLLSGHAANIEKWRFEQAVKRTEERRPDLLKKE
ncbi:tRNA (guanosine(37)-N1)-methyltransferase TrmD [Marivirga arenosa]|jgi:tRNA (guanine37-N1)-methyltransferase|uniref:tRNA (guanine-N(1)-)-methyltransferase n=1 Tax=Marivirga arenosa TaxID=3059076 RepID=A0AA49GCY1_9BACT|nr:tRNA (guanosine(37)-N1)-methyltransferase TrmD [Marivirga sp. BKB1-2]WKK82231.1 tRNA (guanosine(37)-N1)-methyltransferase TrmD [Marivirga sp. BKB1-2]